MAARIEDDSEGEIFEGKKTRNQTKIFHVYYINRDKVCR